MSQRNSAFFRGALIFEFALLLPALAIAYFAPAARWWERLLEFSFVDLGLTLASSLVLIGLGALLLSEKAQELPLIREIYELLQKQLGRVIANLSLSQIAVIAAVAGFAEEVLFRGALQPTIGLALASVLFGLVHAVTLGYFVLATLMGFFLGGIALIGDSLWPAILAHAIYDLFAFHQIRRRFRSRSQSLTEASGSPD